MKTIILKKWYDVKIGIDDNEIGKEITSIFLIHSVLITKPDQGFDIEKMRHHIKILDKLDHLDKDTNSLILEDSEYEALKNALNAFRWGFAHKCFIEFTDSILKPE
jgi:hypothetical protein